MSLMFYNYLILFEQHLFNIPYTPITYNNTYEKVHDKDSVFTDVTHEMITNKKLQ